MNPFSDLQIIEKLSAYCAYQERCAQDVRLKMGKLKVEKERFDFFLQKLEQLGFLNEERYAKTFIKSKLKRKWGKMKIAAALSAKRIDKAVVKELLSGADKEDYSAQILALAERKAKTIKAKSKQDARTKLMRFLLQRGFEMKAVNEALKALSAQH